jgi:hypothetical protein
VHRRLIQIVCVLGLAGGLAIATHSVVAFYLGGVAIRDSGLTGYAVLFAVGVGVVVANVFALRGRHRLASGGRANGVPPPAHADPFGRLRDGLSVLRDELANYVRANGYEPQPQSPAERELTRFPRPESVHTAHGQACMLVEVTADQLTAFIKTVSDPVETIAPYTCVRSLLEAAALSCWILDPAIDARIRVARSLALRYEGILQQQKWARAAGEDPGKASTRLDEVAKVAQSLGYQAIKDARGQHCGAGMRMPSVTDIIRDMLDEEPLYRLLSAVAHGHHWAIHRLSFALAPSQDSISPISGANLRGVTKQANVVGFAMLVIAAAIALARTAWYHARYLGWDRSTLATLLERHFDQLGATHAVRFWRAAT